MADNSKIEWTDASWTVVTGCDRVSPGCARCYALTMAPRLKAMGNPGYQKDGDPKTSGPGFGVTLNEDRLDWPLRWKRPRRIFTTSMGDLFHPEVPDAFIDRVFAVMALARQHTFQVLTKRPERMREYMTRTWGSPGGGHGDRMAAVYHAASQTDYDAYQAMGSPLPWPLPNVWLGTSVENARWRTRIDELRETPAVVRFLSCEPLLGPLTGPTEAPHAVLEYGLGSVIAVEPLTLALGGLNLTGIDWVIIGGESGPGARPMREEWVRAIVAECRAQGAAPFVKQMGRQWAIEHGWGAGHGGDISTFPVDIAIREYPG